MKTIMKTIIMLMLSVLLFFFIAETSISINPFKITLLRPWFAIGIFALSVCITMVYNEGVENGKKEIIKELTTFIEKETIKK